MRRKARPALAGVTIRAAVHPDAAEIARLIRQAKADAMPWLATPHSLVEDEEWAANVLLRDHRVKVAEVNDPTSRIIGVLATSTGWIDQLYIAPGFQGRGLGSRLLKNAQGAATGLLQLWTFQRNSRARAFYERHGFVAVRQTEGENEENEPDVLYVWRR